MDSRTPSPPPPQPGPVAESAAVLQVGHPAQIVVRQCTCRWLEQLI
jgi:hypothetical protein